MPRTAIKPSSPQLQVVKYWRDRNQSFEPTCEGIFQENIHTTLHTGLGERETVLRGRAERRESDCSSGAGGTFWIAIENKKPLTEEQKISVISLEGINVHLFSFVGGDDAAADEAKKETRKFDVRYTHKA
ncbi:hypothetical protein ACLOJK_039711 [Asimina triloba]